MKTPKNNFLKYRIDPLRENGKFDFDFYARKDYNIKKEYLIKYMEEEGFFETTGTYIFYNEKEYDLPYCWWVCVN
jgi:hypothetical protein